MADPTDNREMFVATVQNAVAERSDLEMYDMRRGQDHIVVLLKRGSKCAAVAMSALEADTVPHNLIPTIAGERAQQAIAHLDG